MKIPRRHILRMTAGACALAVAPRLAFTQSYPTRPVHLLVGFPAGTTADVFAREIGQSLADRLGRPFVVENRPGAGSSIAAEAVVGAPPDGHMLLWETAANTTATTFYDNLKFDLVRDIAPVGAVVRTFTVMVANPSLPGRTLPEFIAYAKANPGKINAAVGGNGTLFHLAAELFKLTADVDMVTVVYRGDGPALTDVLGGQVQVGFVGSSAAYQQLKTGRLRALAVSSPMRWDEMPNVPTLAEFVPGYEAIGWQGIGAPKGTPPVIIDRLNQAINASLMQVDLQGRFAMQGGTPLTGSPADFARLVATDTEKWGKVIRAAHIRAE